MHLPNRGWENYDFLFVCILGMKHMFDCLCSTMVVVVCSFFVHMWWRCSIFVNFFIWRMGSYSLRFILWKNVCMMWLWKPLPCVQREGSLTIYLFPTFLDLFRIFFITNFKISRKAWVIRWSGPNQSDLDQIRLVWIRNFLAKSERSDARIPLIRSKPSWL